MTTVIIDQGFIASPYGLQQEPMRWPDFLAMVEASPYRKYARFVEGDRPTPPRRATVAYWEGTDGNVTCDANFDSM